MNRAELERRIALVREARDRRNGKELDEEALKVILPDASPEVRPSPAVWLKLKRNGVVGVTIFRRKNEKLFRAHIKTPDGKILKSKPLRKWFIAVRIRNKWAARYYPDMPEYLCDYESAMDLFGDE